MTKKANTKHTGFPKEASAAVTRYSKAHHLLNLVAPQEADFQIAAMQRTGEIQAVFSNDSDQLVLGCDLVVQFIEKYFADRCVQIKNLGILSKIAQTPGAEQTVARLRR